jgi:hypothetical protein
MEKTPLQDNNLDAYQKSARTKLQDALATFPQQGQAIRHDEVSGKPKPGSKKRSNH